MRQSTDAIQSIIRHLLTNRITDDLLPVPDKAEFGRFCIQYFKEIAYDKAASLDLREREPHAAYSMGTDDDDAIILDPVPSVEVAPLPSNRVIAEVTIAYPEELPETVSVLLRSDRNAIEYRPILKRNGVGLHLSLEETLIVVNTLAAKHAEIRGGAWSGLGKRLELPLMLTLAKLYQVPPSHYAGKGLTGEAREIDFHFLSKSGDQFFCEVKLMGKGNPESADSTIARRSNIFIAQTLSDKNKSQLTNRGHHWVELGAQDGYKRIFTVFKYLDVPCVEFAGDLGAALDEIIPQVFAEIA
ncbi:MAG: CfrBI family restriction endonuclease [Chloroflexi bacterium]|nr:CfrBI family restriction endonuclease [Chloroflexota bacterium]